MTQDIRKVCVDCGRWRSMDQFTLDPYRRHCDRCFKDWHGGEIQDRALHDNYGEIKVGKLNV